MNPFQQVNLGRSSIKVTRIGLGGAALAEMFTEVPEDQAIGTLRRAQEVGVTLFDTAPFYGLGKGEVRTGKALAGVSRDSYILSTKVGRVLEPEETLAPSHEFFCNIPPVRLVWDFSYDGAMRSYEESLRRLNLGRIDILHIHDADNHWEEAIRGAYPALHKLREQGAIRAISVGMNQTEMLTRFAREGDFDCFLLAGRYTLLDQSALREFFPLCMQKGIGIILGGPYNSGILATGAQPGAKFSYFNAPPEILEQVRRIEEVCGAHGVPLKAAALQFTLAHPAVASVIPGSRSPAELDENIRMLNFPIPAAFWSELRDRKLLPPEAPVPQGDAQA
jgi:D-threo-aldose 1-dehydrogenase